MHDNLTPAFGMIARRLLRGRVVPVLGAGVNLCDRPCDTPWQLGTYLPSGAELAAELAIEYPMIDSGDLAKIAQYIETMTGSLALYEELHAVFNADYPPTRLHRMLARLARHVREKATPQPHLRDPKDAKECMLFVTTNYDDSLERAFGEINEPFDVVTYIAEGQDRGKFRHTTPDGHSIVIGKPNEYVGVRLDQRTVIAKVHGAVDRAEQQDSYVITEDHYIAYITRADVNSLFPVTLAAKLRTSHLLFLGYSLRDWNLRVMLHRLWGEQDGHEIQSWAVQSDPNPFDQKAWIRRGVDILPVRVESFVDAIRGWMPGEEVEVA